MKQITQNEDGTINIDGRIYCPTPAITNQPEAMPNKQLTIEEVFRANNSIFFLTANNIVNKWVLPNEGELSEQTGLPTELHAKKIQALIKMWNIMWYFQKDWKPKEQETIYFIYFNKTILKDRLAENISIGIRLPFKERHFAEEALRLMGSDIDLLID